MISIDGSVFIQIINFIFLIWAMNMILYKPIRKMLLQRKEIVSNLDNAIESCNSRIQEKEKLIQDATAEEKLVVEKINTRAQAELEEIRNRITKDAGTVRDALHQELGSMVAAISQKILGRAV